MAIDRWIPHGNGSTDARPRHGRRPGAGARLARQVLIFVIVVAAVRAAVGVWPAAAVGAAAATFTLVNAWATLERRVAR
ncbi:MAG TPA: hypothetical protein VFZ79_00840 [Acidimicrobiales bacterium]